MSIKWQIKMFLENAFVRVTFRCYLSNCLLLSVSFVTMNANTTISIYRREKSLESATNSHEWRLWTLSFLKHTNNNPKQNNMKMSWCDEWFTGSLPRWEKKDQYFAVLLSAWIQCKQRKNNPIQKNSTWTQWSGTRQKCHFFDWNYSLTFHRRALGVWLLFGD